MSTMNIFDMTDTWDAAGTTFVGIKLNATDTASAAGSLLMDLQVGGASRFSVSKNGFLTLKGIGAELSIGYTAETNVLLQQGGLINSSLGHVAWSSSSTAVSGGNRDLFLYRDAANTLAQRNGVNAQAFRVYGTYTDASNYERGKMEWSSNRFEVGTEAAGTGSARDLYLISGSGNMRIGKSGAVVNLLFNGDNDADIGASGANRPRRLYLGGGSLTGSAADSSVEISPTWNTTGTPTAIKANITDTASNAASLLMDLQVGGVSRTRIDKIGNISFPNSSSTQPSSAGVGNWVGTLALFGNGGVLAATVGGSNLNLGSNVSFSIGSDTILARDAANTLAQRNGVNAQAFRVYNTYTDASNYERGFMRWASNVLQIGAEAAGTGTARTLEFYTNGAARLTIATNGAVNVPTSGFTVLGSFAVTTGYNSVLWSDGVLGWGSATVGPSTAPDTGFRRASAAIIAVTNGSTGGGAMQMTEMTAPAAPAANGVRIYAVDNGSGKTQLMALFATGAAQQIAIEP